MDIPTPLPAQPTRFLDKVRSFMRLRGMAYKTEKTYLFWIKRFIRFHGLQHPETMGSMEVESFLSHLVLQANASASTQRVALNALVFLYREFLGKPLDDLKFEQSRKPVKLPTVFSKEEASSVIRNLSGGYKLVAMLLYGSGLRIKPRVCLRPAMISALSRSYSATRICALRKSILMSFARAVLAFAARLTKASNSPSYWLEFA